MIIELPTHLSMGVRKVKSIPLNLNHYRNADPFLLNNMKILFGNIVAPRLKDVPFMDRVALAYRLYMPSKRAVDISNVCCIVDKFFCDTLKNAKKIPDDNMDVIYSIRYLWGGVDKENPRVEVTLMDEDDSMQITTVVKLDENDIRSAIEEYVAKELPARDHHNLSVDLGMYDGLIAASVTVGGAAMGKPRGRPRKTAEAPAEAIEQPIQEPIPEGISAEPEPEPEVEAEADAVITSGDAEEPYYPVPTQEPLVQETAPEPEKVAEASPAPAKSLFPTKASTASAPAAEASAKATTTTATTPAPKPAATAPATGGKSLFSLKGMTAPKSDTK